MNKFKKVIVIMLGVVMILSFLTACNPEEPIDSQLSSSSQESGDTPAPITGTVSVAIEVQFRTAFNQFIARFEDKNPGIKIEALYNKDQNTLIAAGQAPDLLKSGDLHLVAMKDSMLPLDDYISNDNEIDMDDFFPNAVNSLVVDGKQLALPTFFNVGLLYYNKTLFDNAQLDYPTSTWTNEDFVNAAKALTISADGKYTQWGTSTVLGWWGEWLIHVRQAGGDWMKDDKCVLDTPEAIAGLQFFYDKTTKGNLKIAPSTTDDALGGFAGGKTGMEYGGHTGLWVSYSSTPDLNWDIEVLPEGLARREGAEFAVDAYGIYKDSKNPDAAWEVLKYWTGKEGGELMADMGRPVARKSVAAKVLSVPIAERAAPQNLEALYAAVETGMTLPTDPNFIPCTQQVVQPFIDRLLEGRITAEEAGKEATIEANQYLEQNR